MFKRRLALILCCMFVLTGVLAAKQKGRGRGRGDEKRDRFEQNDVRVIVEYYRIHDKGHKMPPGLVKQLRRNGHLPPGLEKKLVPFPVEVERRLPPCPYGMRRGLIDGVAVMFNVRTGIVVDFAAVFGN
jgi:hypothetical protein